MSTSDEAGRRGTSVIGNLLDVLRCFTVQDPVQGVTEIAEKVGLHKSSVSRTLSALEAEHIVERDPASRRFRLGMGLIDVAGPLLAGLEVRAVARPHLEDLAESSRETVVLTVWNGSWATCVDQIVSPRLIKHASPLGQRYETALSASVQVFLAAEPAHRRDELFSSGTIELPATAREDFTARLETVGRQGIAVNDGETQEDEFGLAAPVLDHLGGVAAAVLLAAPRYRVDADTATALRRQVHEAAHAASLRMGYVPGTSPA